MNKIFEVLFQYGFHDTEISSIDCEGLEIKLSFNKGVYLLNRSGKEHVLSNPMLIVLKINSSFDSFLESFEIKEYGKKMKYIEYSVLLKYLKNDAFGITMVYYSNFNNSILFDGGIDKKNLMISIEGIKDITFTDLHNAD